jgi:hypothetical protein
MKPIVVTGYVKIPGHPRSRDEYERLGTELQKITAAPILATRGELDLASCWLTSLIRLSDFSDVTHSAGDNPGKNTLSYHVVQHQKTAWLWEAASLAESKIDVLVWVDYGIFSQPGITVDVIDAFLRRIIAIDKLNEIFIPGAWERSNDRSDTPDWHFCGSLLIMPRAHAYAFHKAVHNVTLARLVATRHVTWEINDWAAVERQEVLPIRWYKGDHNETQFANFGAHLVTR